MTEAAVGGITSVVLPDGREGKPGTCKSEKCKATVFWAASPRTGKLAPYNADGVSHFATCPDAPMFRAKAQQVKATPATGASAEKNPRAG